jgi:hypothetical protein
MPPPAPVAVSLTMDTFTKEKVVQLQSCKIPALFCMSRTGKALLLLEFVLAALVIVMFLKVG